MTTRQLSDDPFPLEERTYYVSPRRARRRRRNRLPPSLLLAALLFAGGFLLGRTAAAEPPVPPAGAETSSALSLSSPETPPVPVAILPRPDGGEADGPAPAPETGEDWALLLVNGDHPLPEDFAVPALTQLKNGHQFDSRAYPALQRMMDGARAAGLRPVICSSFRTWDKQAELFERKVQTYLDRGCGRAEAEAAAAQWVARPGTSEHQAGLAVDIVDLDYQLLDGGQEKTAVQQWLLEHCAAYGFILRYPTGKSGLTGVEYEPWHYRYVGEDAARAITDRGLCLEEYLAEAR